MCERIQPASKIRHGTVGLIKTYRLPQSTTLSGEEESNPADAIKANLGKRSAVALPILALATAISRSARRISGRRSINSDGLPTGTCGGTGGNLPTSSRLPIVRRVLWSESPRRAPSSRWAALAPTFCPRFPTRSRSGLLRS